MAYQSLAGFVKDLTIHFKFGSGSIQFHIDKYTFNQTRKYA